MATQPIKCPYDVLEGFRFYRGNLVLDNGMTTNPPKYLSLEDLNIAVDRFSRSRVTLKPGGYSLLSQTDIGDEYGYVSFIAVKAIYPSSTVESRKYINWTYQNATNYMGELMVLSGQRISSVDSEFEGWNLSKPGTLSINSPGNGGIVFHNPSSDTTVKLEILVCG
jgi:hypothetical protein